MADNAPFQSVTPATLPPGFAPATDDVGGVAYQRIKLDLGGDGAASPLVRGAQASTSSIPVVLSTEQQAMIDGIEASLTAIAGYVDGIETLLTAVDGHVDGLEPLITATNAALAKIYPGSEVALSAPASALTAATDTTFTFASEIRHLLIQNNSAATVGVGFGAAATAGSLQVPAGATLALDVPVTAVHLYSAPATNVNGSSAGNIVLKGWA